MPTAILKDETTFEITDAMAQAIRDYRAACDELMQNAEWLSAHRRAAALQGQLNVVAEEANMLAGPYHKRMKEAMERAEAETGGLQIWPAYMLFEDVRADYKPGWESVSYPVDKVRKLILGKHPELATEFAAIAKLRKQAHTLTLGYFARDPDAPAPGDGRPKEEAPF